LKAIDSACGSRFIVNEINRQIRQLNMTSNNRFPGVALVTGAGGTGWCRLNLSRVSIANALVIVIGIGAAVARALANEGCTRIAITDINESTLANTRRAILEINPQAIVCALAGDITKPEFVASLVDTVVKTLSRIDYSIQCAGVLGKGQRSHETSVEDFDRINNINYKGTWLVARASIAQMLGQAPLTEHPKQRGALVNIASQLGIVARPGAGMSCVILSFYSMRLTMLVLIAPYCASKAAIINMTKSDAIDYSSDLIQVNCVCPGVIATPMTTGNKEVEERLRPAVEIAPMKRMGTPEEVADAVLFLCSAQSSFIQGHALVVDGGYTIN
jgi:NAD(P)-dependent dehydrogenase (short-subunit alcohol dehydrogenase family)